MALAYAEKSGTGANLLSEWMSETRSFEDRIRHDTDPHLTPCSDSTRNAAAAGGSKIGEQPQWFIAATALQPDDYVIVRPHLGEELPAFSGISGAIFSGSWAMVTDHADWSERTAAGFVQPSTRNCRCCGAYALLWAITRTAGSAG